MNELKHVVQSKSHLIWLLLLSVIAIAGASFIAFRLEPGIAVLWVLLVILFYCTGFLLLLLYTKYSRLTHHQMAGTRRTVSDIAGTVARSSSLIRKLDSKISKSDTVLLNVAGTVGRSASLMRRVDTSTAAIEASMAESAPLLRDVKKKAARLETATREIHEHQVRTFESSLKRDELIAQAADLALIDAGLTRSTRKFLIELDRLQNVLVISSSNWLKNAFALNMTSHCSSTKIIPEDIPNYPISGLARLDGLVIDFPDLELVSRQYLSWVSKYLRWAPNAAIYFVDSGSNDAGPVVVGPELRPLRCSISVINGLTVASSLKIRK